MKTISQVRKKIEGPTRLQSTYASTGLSLRELAAYTGVSVPTLSRVGQGKAPDIRTALKLARFFETTVEDLFGDWGKGSRF